MKKTKLNTVEHKIEDNILEYKTVSAAKKKRIQDIIKKANEKKISV